MKNIEKAFEISLGDMKNIVRDFHEEMERGLAGEKSSLKMIHTYAKRPTGNESGQFLALDVGGTNFRILEIELKGHGTIGRAKTIIYSLHKKYITASAVQFFGYLADCIKAFMKKERVDTRKRYRLGFTFSFPIRQTGMANGDLISWTKGFNVKGVIGHDVVGLLSDAILKRGLDNIRVTALINDTVGTLITGGYADPHCDVGVIIGTGTNACYAQSGAIINIEWGNFNKLKRTPYDKRLDKASSNPGRQVLEKMVSGMYIGELSRRIFRDFIKHKNFFDKIGSFKSEHMSIIEADASVDLRNADILFRRLGAGPSTAYNRRLIKKICEVVSRRAARISASAIYAVITKVDPALYERHIIAIDGSVYEKHPGFSKNIRLALKELAGSDFSKIEISLTKDGSGKGAAIMTAVA